MVEAEMLVKPMFVTAPLDDHGRSSIHGSCSVFYMFMSPSYSPENMINVPND